MQAAILAGCHLTNLYKLRNKLGAFKREGVWYIPTDTLRHYIQRRAARAQAILDSVASATEADRLQVQ
jgi:hypothetical protein